MARIAKSTGLQRCDSDNYYTNYNWCNTPIITTPIIYNWCKDFQILTRHIEYCCNTVCRIRAAFLKLGLRRSFQGGHKNVFIK